jgi:hypothetical protein
MGNGKPPGGYFREKSICLQGNGVIGIKIRELLPKLPDFGGEHLPLIALIPSAFRQIDRICHAVRAG